MAKFLAGQIKALSGAVASEEVPAAQRRAAKSSKRPSAKKASSAKKPNAKKASSAKKAKAPAKGKAKVKRGKKAARASS